MTIHSIWNWLLAPDASRQPTYDTPLLAVASIAVVIWTGGFVLRSLKPSLGAAQLVGLMWAMDYLQTAFMVASYSLIWAPHGLRIGALLYLAIYLSGEMKIARAVRSIDRALPPTGFTIREMVQRYLLNIAKTVRTSGWTSYIRNRTILHGGVIVGFAWPTAPIVATIAWVWTLIGMWTLVQYLFAELYTE